MSIPASVKVPGTFLEVALGAGPATAADQARKVLVFGNKNTGGTATVEQVVAVTSIDDARTLFGDGSELFLMCRAAIRANPSVTLYAIPIAEATGTNASGTFSITGSATSSGTIIVWILGERIEVGVASGDANTVVGSAIEAAINARTDLPVTAAHAAGTVTVTARHDGPRGNHISMRSDDSAVAGVTIADSGAYLASGATSDDPQNALDAVAAERYHYLVAPYDDATNLADFETHVDAEAAPEIGHREQVVFASLDTLANVTTVATTLNAARCQVGWHYNADDTPAMMAATLAAVRAGEESSDPAANLDNVALPYLKAQSNPADYPVYSEQVSALNNGITPFVVTAGGDVVIGRSITTRSQDASANPNYSVLDTSKVTVPDYVADDIAVGFPQEFAGYKVAPDSSDGTPPTPGVNIATPKTIRDWLASRLKAHEEDGLLVEVEENLPSLVVTLADSPAGRVNATIPVDVIEGLHQLDGTVKQIG